MLFRRREPAKLRERVRLALWPRRSWRRSLAYAGRRLYRVQARPHEIGLGCAAGVFASVTPLLGLQMLVAVLIAAALRASIPAALLGTFFGNPISWPFIWAGTYALGSQMLGIAGQFDPLELRRQFGLLWEAAIAASPHVLGQLNGILWPIVKPMLAGSVPIGLLAAVVVYYASHRAASAYQRRRRATFVAGREALQTEAF